MTRINLNAVASLPTRDEAIAKLMSVMKAPIDEICSYTCRTSC